MFSSFFPFSIHSVHGHSMQPKIMDGRRAIVLRWLLGKPKKGNIVMFGLNGKNYVKRVVAVEGRKLYVEGDNKADSRKLPPVAFSSVLGKVILSF